MQTVSAPTYPTHAVLVALALAALLTIALMPLHVRLMRRLHAGQQVRDDGPETHLAKQGTPTMGGIVMVASALLPTALLAGFSVPLMCVTAAVVTSCLAGLADDLSSVMRGRSLGLTPSQKMAVLGGMSVAFTLVATNACSVTPVVSVPFGPDIDLGVLSTTISLGWATVTVPWLYVLFSFLLVAGMSNAVNLTDGLDGLASGCSAAVMVALSMVAFRQDMLPLSIFAGALAGSCAGFLWHNGHPASVFMGDTGSLALGTAVAAIAMVCKAEVPALVMGALFVAEALSVIVQVLHFKRTGRRVFLMAPLHHHFEEAGMPEDKVTMRFWLVSAACSVLGFCLFFAT